MRITLSLQERISEENSTSLKLAAALEIDKTTILEASSGYTSKEDTRLEPLYRSIKLLFLMIV